MRIALSIIISLFVLVGLMLIVFDNRPVTWDAAWYLSTSVRLYRSLVLGDLYIFLRAFSQSFKGDKAPLISALPLPFYLVFGTSYISAMFVNICFLILMNIFVYKLVRYIEKDGYAGLFSIIIINTMPLFQDFTRQFMVEYGLGVFVLMSIYFLLKSEYLKQDKYVYLLEVMLGLGLLMKILYPIYLILPVSVVCFIIVRYRKNTIKELIKKFAKIIFIGFTIASIWYFFNLEKVLWYGFHSGYGKFSNWYGLGNIFTISTLIRYFKNFIQECTSLFYFAIFIACFFIFVIKRNSIKFRFNFFSLFLGWFLFPFLILIFAPNKLLRFLLPALIPLPIILGIWLNRIFAKKGFIILLLPFFAYIFQPFIHSSLSKVLFNPPSIDTKSDWKINEIIDSIPLKKMEHRILCAVDHGYYNNFTLDYYSVLKWAPFKFINSNFYQDWQQIRDAIETVDFVIVKTGYLGPDFCNKFNPEIRNFVLDNKQLFKEIRTFELPDKSRISIYERLT